MDIKNIASIVVAFIVNFTFAQKEIYKSDFQISEYNLSNFYSTLQVNNTSVVFNCNAYNLYSIDKKLLKTNWTKYLGRKSNTGLYITDSLIITSKYENDNAKVIVLSANSGEIIQNPPMQTIESEPYVKNNILYCTALNNFGQLIAYDIKNNKIVWEKFIAHGISKKPYYKSDKIIANAEGDNWFEIGYNGILIDTLCKEKASIFVEDIPCIKNFKMLTHDGLMLDDTYLNKKLKIIDTENLKVLYNPKTTVLLGEDNLTIIGNKKKVISNISLSETLDFGELSTENKSILKIDDTFIWIFYNNHIISFNIKSGVKDKIYNLEKWNPHQLIFDENIIWLISQNDGQLYALTLD